MQTSCPEDGQGQRLGPDRNRAPASERGQRLKQKLKRKHPSIGSGPRTPGSRPACAAPQARPCIRFLPRSYSRHPLR
eukprot:scaffold18514_cov112-Isochrysis_galbana.AAC.4